MPVIANNVNGKISVWVSPARVASFSETLPGTAAACGVNASKPLGPWAVPAATGVTEDHRDCVAGFFHALGDEDRERLPAVDVGVSAALAVDELALVGNVANRGVSGIHDDSCGFLADYEHEVSGDGVGVEHGQAPHRLSLTRFGSALAAAAAR